MADMVNTIERGMAPEINDQLERAKSYTQAPGNIRPANDYILECSDGRYTPDQSNGAVRVFGGDVGILFAVMDALDKKGIEYSVDQLVERYSRALQSPQIHRDGKIHYHTDTHSVQENGVGCGHVKRIINENPKAKELFGKIVKLSDNQKNETVLEGKHEEEGVLVVEDSDSTVNSSSMDGQFFVVDMARVRGYMGMITKTLGYEELSSEDVLSSYTEQMSATAMTIAPDKPMFEVRFEGSQPSVSYIGNTPSLS